MVLNSLEEWRSGKNNYSVKDISKEISLETKSFLTRLGINKSPERTESIPTVKVLCDQRWEAHSSRPSFSYVISVFLFMPKIIAYFFFIPARNFLRKLILRKKH